ncbi:hypothetical protein LXA43DRAFT_898702 [Ganoderma leucocontextum]|nr:hypothetical protein LXA43DRAFT_898702 [Ganoderma leucocontextum]
MTVWLERKEKILSHGQYIDWRLQQLLDAPRPEAAVLPHASSSTRLDIPPLPPATEPSHLSAAHIPSAQSTSSRRLIAHPPSNSAAPDPNIPSPVPPRPLVSSQSAQAPRIQISRHPSAKAVKLEDVKVSYGATHFRDALSRFVVEFNNPNLTRQQVERAASHVFFSFQAVPVFHKVKLVIADPDGLAAPGEETQDVIHAAASRKKRGGGVLQGRFDTALIRVRGTGDDEPAGSNGRVDQYTSRCHYQSMLTFSFPALGFRVARVRVIFKIPPRGLDDLFGHVAAEKRPQHLAYVELFTELDSKDAVHGLYKISHARNREGQRLGLIIPLEEIEQSCHLFPDFGRVAPRDWTSKNVLDECTTFYLNSFADRNTYKLIH